MMKVFASGGVIQPCTFQMKQKPMVLVFGVSQHTMCELRISSVSHDSEIMTAQQLKHSFSLVPNMHAEFYQNLNPDLYTLTVQGEG